MNCFSLYDLWKCSNQNFIYTNKLFYEIFFDTRCIINGKIGVYFCFEKNFDQAKNYINEAIEKQVIAIVSPFKINIKKCPILIYHNPIQLLQKFAKKYFSQFEHLKKIAITGSNGKTIVKEWLFQCLNDHYSIIHSPNNYNSQIGVPLAVLQTQYKHKIGIFECGISLPNEMKNIENIIQPHIGILTNINKKHVENFSCTKQLIEEKCLLFNNVKTIFCYCNNYFMYNFFKEKFKKQEIIIIGEKKFCDIQLCFFKKNYIYIRIFSKKYCFKVQIQNRNILFNLLILISVLYHLGFSTIAIQEKILRLQPITMCLKITHGIFNSMIMCDTYGLNLLSMKIAINKLKYLFNKKTIIIIIDSLLNKKSYFNLYKDIINFLNSIIVDHIFLIGQFKKKHKIISTNSISFFVSINSFINSFNKVNISNASILIKGYQIFKLKKFINTLENQSHNTLLEINLNSIYHNIKFFRNCLNKRTKIMAMVKANAYGISEYQIAKFLQYYKIDYLCVAYSDEGVILRQNGIYIPIMVMNISNNSYDDIINYNLEPEIYSLKILTIFLNKLKEKKYIKKKFSIHIKIDTGMHRLGFQKFEIHNLIKKIKKNMLYIDVKSIFTHLVATENKKDYNFILKQINLFEQCYKQIIEQLDCNPLKHVLNTHGVINYLNYQFDMVRIGIGIYGLLSNNNKHVLKNVITLKSKISQIICLKKGDSVGYNRIFIAKKNIKIGTLPIGYADGIFRKLGNTNFSVLINNKKIKIIGAICMDMMMINIKQNNYNEGQEVIIYGEKNSINNIAKLCETIPYEILTSISVRIKRIFIEI